MRRYKKTHTEVLILDEKATRPRLSGSGVRRGRGPRLNSLNLWAVQRLAESPGNHSRPPRAKM